MNDIKISKNPSAGTFFIKKNYLHRLSPKDFGDEFERKDGIIWQPHVISLAGFLGERLGCKYLVDLGCGNGKKLAPHYPKFNIIGIDLSKNLQKCKSSYNFGTWIEHDFEKPEKIDFSKDILKKSIIICSDVIEHLKNPTHLLDNIKKILDHAPVCLITTPERDLRRGENHFGPSPNLHHVREWNMEEFETMLRFNDFKLAFIGLTVTNDKGNKKQTILAGIENNYSVNSLLNVNDWNYPNPDHLILYDRQKEFSNAIK